jgi:hypothetical protein
LKEIHRPNICDAKRNKKHEELRVERCFLPIADNNNENKNIEGNRDQECPEGGGNHHVEKNVECLFERHFSPYLNS